MSQAVLADAVLSDDTPIEQEPILDDNDDGGNYVGVSHSSDTAASLLPDARDVVQQWSQRINAEETSELPPAYAFDVEQPPVYSSEGEGTSLMPSPPPPATGPHMIAPLYDHIEMPFIDRRAVRPVVVSVLCRVVKSRQQNSDTADSGVQSESAPSLLDQPTSAPTQEYWEDKGSLRMPLWPDTRLGELILCLLRRSDSLESLLVSYCERRALPQSSFPVHEVTRRISFLKLSVSVGRVETESKKIAEYGRLGALRFARDGPGSKGFPFVAVLPKRAGVLGGGFEWSAESLVAQLVSPEHKLVLLLALDEIRLDPLP